MKKISLVFLLFFALVFSGTGLPVSSARADDGGRAKTAQYYNVSAAKQLRDDTRVVMRGYIVQRLSDDHYLFRDSTGSIQIEIDDDDDDDDDDRRRRGKKRTLVDSRARVEIRGKVDRDDGSVEIDVNSLRRL